MATTHQDSHPPVRTRLTTGDEPGNGHHYPSTRTDDTAEMERQFQLLLDLLSNEPEIFLIY